MPLVTASIFAGENLISDYIIHCAMMFGRVMMIDFL